MQRLEAFRAHFTVKFENFSWPAVRPGNEGFMYSFFIEMKGIVATLSTSDNLQPSYMQQDISQLLSLYLYNQKYRRLEILHSFTHNKR